MKKINLFTPTLFLLLFLSEINFGQTIINNTTFQKLISTNNVNSVFHPKNNNHVIGKNRNAVFVFDYQNVGITPSERAAIEYAGSLWEQCLTSSIPIKVHVMNTLEPFPTVAITGPNKYIANYYSGSNPDYETNIFFPMALANFISNIDNDTDPTTGYDILLQINNFFDLSWNGESFYTGLDGNAGINQYDLVTVALHEIGHGLGMISSLHLNGTDWNYGKLDAVQGIYLPTKYETFIQSIVNNNFLINEQMNIGSNTLNSLIQNGCEFNGNNAYFANFNSNPKLTNSNFSTGYVGIGELDFSLYPNEIMSSTINLGQGNHSIQDISVGVMNDLGWLAHIVTGIEDNIEIKKPNYSAPITELSLNTPYLYRLKFTDNAPIGDWLSGVQTWELRLLHKDGYYVYNNANNIVDFNLTISNIPSNYQWLRTIDGKIRAEIVATALDNHNISHNCTLEVDINYQPDTPEIELKINGGTSNCENVFISFYSRGANPNSYTLSYKESNTFSWISVVLPKGCNQIQLFGFDPNKNYDIYVSASNGYGSSNKTITKTKCLFPVIISPNPARTDFEVKSLDIENLIQHINIIDVSSGTIVNQIDLESPALSTKVNIAELLIGNYIIQISSNNNLTVNCKLQKE